MANSEPFARHRRPFYAMAIAPDGRWLVASGRDGFLTRWDTTNGRPSGAPIEADSNSVLAVTVTPDGRQIVSGGYDGVVRVWDVETGNLTRSLGNSMRAVWTVRVSSDGTRVLAGGADGELHVWNLTDGQLTNTFSHAGSIRAICVSPITEEIIWAGKETSIRRASYDGRLKEPLLGHVGLIHALTLTPDSARLVSGGGDGTIRQWDLSSGMEIGEAVHGHEGAVFAVAVTSDGSQILSGGGDGTVRRWNLASGTAIGDPLRGHTDSIRSIQVSPTDNRAFSCSNDGTIIQWSFNATTVTRESLPGPSVPVNALAVQSWPPEVFSASIDGAIRRWDGATGRSLGRFRAPDGWVNAIALSPDGRLLARVGESDTIVCSNAHTGEYVGEPLTGHPGGVRAVTFTPDSQLLVSAGADGTVRRWNSSTGEPLGKHLTGHRGPVNSVCVSPDGSQIIAAGSQDGRLLRWDVATGDRVGDPINAHSPAALTVSIDRTGRRIVSGGSDGRIRVWDASSGRAITSPKVGHIGSVTVVRFSPDGNRIFSGGTDHVISEWDTVTGERVGDAYIGHEGTITSLAFLDDGGAVLLSGSADGTVRRWDIAHQKELPAGADLPTVVKEVVADVQSDLESSDDRLGIGNDVRLIGAMLAATTVRPPLSVALLGDWGSGKSTFMVQLRRWLVDAAERAEGSLTSTFVSNLRQVTFNAWHYSDDHLWVGLVEHMFQELAVTDAVVDQATAERVTELKTALSTRKSDRERLTADLEAIDRIEADRGWFAAARAPLRSARVARAAVTSGWRELRTHRGWPFLLVAVVGIAGVVFSIRFGQDQLAWIAGAIAALAPVAAAWRTLHESTENVRKQLLRRKDELDADIKKTDDALARVEPAHRLDRLLAEISTAERYESFRGLTGRIHHDLRRLSDDLAMARAAWSDDGARGRPPLQRIVLYVDDLDRCTPQRVADVLQAINLLLTMDLFMVVVAVDPRWLMKALKRYHLGLLHDAVTPLDYLDKIFHIPFALRPMGAQASDYLRSMLPVDTGPRPAILPRVGYRQNPAQPDTESTAVEADTSTEIEQPDPVQFQNRPRRRPANYSPSDLAPEGMKLQPFEQDFLANLVSLLPTPRAVKKLANLYRLIRLSVAPEQLDMFLIRQEFHAAALLLAALVSDPRGTRELMIRLGDAAGQDIVDVLEGNGLPHRLSVLIKAERVAGREVHGELGTYQRWATAIARYGFETYDLFVATR
ncbi:P-loop NTPase fold protein [Amycolatopsis sp. NPDC005961]|uniref:P-loop NTPase fold protein n=1 Tax=Amycolatopsis sp. NPDC005961 TaxID=3156720 RepID=UPI0033E159F6